LHFFFNSDTQVSDALVHMDYYTALLTRAWNGNQVYWDSWKQVERCFTTSLYLQLSPKYDLIRHANITTSSVIWLVISNHEISPAPYDQKCCLDHQTLFACAEEPGTRICSSLHNNSWTERDWYMLIVWVELVYYITAKTNLILKIPGFCAWTNYWTKKV